MKKLMLSLLLSTVAMNALGMQQYQEDNDGKYLAVALISIAGIGAATIGGCVYLEYLKSRLAYSHVFKNANTNKQENTQSSWMPYAKIAAGLGLTGLTTYLGCKQTHQPQNMITHYSGSNSTDIGNTLSPNIMISFASAYTLAPMVPAYFLLKSGYEDLKAERDLQSYKEYNKEHQNVAPAIANQSQVPPTYI